MAKPDYRSPEAEQYRKHYKTARWQKLRWSILVRDMFTCQRCKRIEIDTSKLHCDHVTPHKGDEQAFWSGPFATLCHACHNSAKQSEERTGKAKPLITIGLDGWPT